VSHAESVRAFLDRLQFRALIAGGIGVALCVLGALTTPEQFYRSYLIAFAYWLGISLGCLALAMLYQLVGGLWGLVTRRVFEAGAGTVVLLAIAFVPLVFGLQDLYIWSHLPPSEFWATQISRLGLADAYQSLYPIAIAGDAKLLHKSVYLNTPFVLIRAVLYFAVWIALTLVFSRWSPIRQQSEDRHAPAAMRLSAAAGIVLVGLTFTFASVDWLMSLDAHWYSSIYAFMLAAGGAVGAMSLIIVILAQAARHSELAELIPPGAFNDLGSLLLAFLMLWAYMSFSQFLIIWSGDLPVEISWYITRLGNGWKWIGLLIVLLHFVLPFFLLLSKDRKRSPLGLGMVAAGLLVMHYVDWYWVIAPSYGDGGLRIHWLDAAALFGIGGLWLALFAMRLKRRPWLADIELAAEEHAADH
jgi:hypothetical protein